MLRIDDLVEMCSEQIVVACASSAASSPPMHHRIMVCSERTNEVARLAVSSAKLLAISNASAPRNQTRGQSVKLCSRPLNMRLISEQCRLKLASMSSDDCRSIPNEVTSVVVSPIAALLSLVVYSIVARYQL